MSNRILDGDSNANQKEKRTIGTKAVKDQAGSSRNRCLQTAQAQV